MEGERIPNITLLKKKQVIFEQSQVESEERIDDPSAYRLKWER